ncbi:MAG: DNA translocase FtsK 4TM domain-containing protein, partial [Tannerella sp.]|nr:DNA translocase FtsK 4TM domain-containing protein [Tannerella sp.]
MAKKATKKKHSEEEILDSIGSFVSNERVQFAAGIILNVLMIYTGFALVSFFFTGGADQSAVENLSAKDILANNGRVGNWAGVRGAFIADVMVNRWFGVASFFFLFFMGSWGVKLMKICRLSLFKRALFCVTMLFWSSIFFSFVFIRGYEDTFIYLGGKYGYHITESMKQNVGIPGTVLFLIVVILIIAVCSSKRSMPFLQETFSFSWLQRWIEKRGKRKKNRKPKKNPDKNENNEETDDEDEEDEDDEDDVIIPAGKPQKTGPGLTEPSTTSVKNEDNEEIVFTIDVPVAEAAEAYDVSLLGEYDPRLDLSSYRFPTLELLNKYNQNETPVNMEEQAENQKRIKQTLENFGISIASIKATVGPTLTLYEVVPAVGVRISKIRNLEDDIALSLSALGIRIIAPMPGKGTIGIEVPNKEAQIVSMQSLITSRKFNECKFDLPVALGRTISNEVFMFDLCKAPHLLMAGATGQGKSVGLNAIITSLLYKKHPAELKFVLIDPKMVEFAIYADIERHYLAKLPDEDRAIITDHTRVIYTLNSLCKEMDDRYELLTKAHVRNIK